MSSPLERKAAIVAELQERVAAVFDEDRTDAEAEFLASALTDQGVDLEAMCARALREALNTEAMAEGMKSVIEANRTRKARLEQKAQTIRAAVAHAMQESGLPKITAPDMTVSFRMGKPPLIIDGDPDILAPSWAANMREVYSWNKDAIREELKRGLTDLSLGNATARLGNPEPTITVRSK